MRRVTKNKITLYLSHKDIALELSKDKYSDLEFYSLFHESYGDIVVFTEKNIENLLINLNLKLKKLKIINEKGIKCRILLTAEK
ncbi:hypothetical protein HYX16_04930 [Candidatus Woesearchaeota archaeon]|nr:hypothetical protein [Candidatus Woesearchaeota archaeon]